MTRNELPLFATETALTDLAQQINTEHDACVAAATVAVDLAFAVGKLLVEAKRRVRHGEWSSWVETNCRFSVRMAQNYMRAAKNEARFAFGHDRPRSLRHALEVLVATNEDAAAEDNDPTLVAPDMSPAPLSPVAAAWNAAYTAMDEAHTAGKEYTGWEALNCAAGAYLGDRSDPVMVPIAALDPEFGPASGMRVQLSCDAVLDYAEVLDQMPPIFLLFDQAERLHWVVDGRHTVAAALIKGRTKIKAVVRVGRYVEAFALACRANKKCGLRYTRKEGAKNAERFKSLGGRDSLSSSG